MLRDLETRLRERGLKLDVDDAAVALLVERGYDPVYGARPLKRHIQTDLETPIARAILQGSFASEATVRVTAAKGEFGIDIQ